MLLLSSGIVAGAIQEYASEWDRASDGRWLCVAAETPVKWMLGQEACATKERLVAHGVDYRLMKTASLLWWLVNILTGTGGNGVPVAAMRERVLDAKSTFRDEYGVELPPAWEMLMAWCDGFMVGRIEVFGTANPGHRPDWPRGIVEANRMLRATVSNRVVWLGAMVGVSLGLDLDSGMCVGVDNADRSVWKAMRTPAELLVWMAGLVTAREVTLLHPLTECDWSSHVAASRDTGQRAPSTTSTGFTGRPGEQYRYGL